MSSSPPSLERTRAFFDAIRPGNGPSVRRRLSLGMPVDVTQDDSGFTALHVAALRGAADVVDVLLERGAEPNRVTARGDSVLVSAAYNGNARVVERLVEAGASVHGPACARALPLALRKQHFEAARVLIAAGADVNAVDETSQNAPLEDAIKAGASREVIEALIRAGADVNGRGFFRPLVCAISENQLDTLVLLLESGADVNTKNEYGDTALMHAAGADKLDAALRLLDRGAAVDARERRAGMTALMDAARSAHHRILELLIARGADPHLADTAGKTALTYAQLAGCDAAIEVLRGRGVAEPEQFAAEIEAARVAREALRAKEAAERAAFVALGVEPRPGKVTAGPFASFAGIAYIDATGAVRARVEIFGRSTEITLEASQFAFDA